MPLRFTRLLVAAAFLGCGLLAAQESAEDQEDAAIKAAAAKAAPSVVRIETVGGLEIVGQSLAATGPTTGLIVSEDGYVVSSSFNFVHKPNSILVTLPNGKRAAAEVVGKDHSRMLVLLKVKSDQPLPVPQAAPKKDMQPGQWAIAVGRTFEADAPGISVGIISALDRVWSKAIQTDAKISPGNYGGALVDIRGRVLGVLVPLSPHGQGSEMAGAEWYDSGIGFAVPLEDIFARLDRWKSGSDLHPGLLGISLKPGDIYSLPAEIAAAQVTGPAAKAGLKKGDVLIEADGKKITRQAELKHALGPFYAGEKVKLVALRGDEKTRIEATVELTDKLAAYVRPFLGILPERRAGASAVRWVYPDSPAAKAGLQAGDKILTLNDEATAHAAALRGKFALLEPKQKAKLGIERGGEKLTLEVTPGKSPTTIPAELPPAAAAPLLPAGVKAGLTEIKLPEEKNACPAFVPETYHPDTPHGLLIWLATPGKFEGEQLKNRWNDLAAKHAFIVIAPRPADPAKWEPTETEFIRKAADEAGKTYTIDPERTAILGEGAGAGMAWFAATSRPERIRGAALIDGGLSPLIAPPSTDPLNPLAFYLGVAGKTPAAAALRATAKKLQEAEFPVTLKELGDKSRPLDQAESAELARWLDTLDRI